MKRVNSGTVCMDTVVQNLIRIWRVNHSHIPNYNNIIDKKTLEDKI